MKVVVSLTSVPSRFDKLEAVLTPLLLQTCHEIWLNIPPKYDRFPEWDGMVPGWLFNFDPKLKVNLDCEDLGPGTKFFGSAKHLDPEDLIVYLDDDTDYDPRLVTNLLKWRRTDPTSAWGLSGFNFETYFKGVFPRQHGVPVDVLEGYGSVIVKAGWIHKIEAEYKELLDVTRNDDMILSNLFEKYGIERKTCYTPDFHLGHVRQRDYGFGPDALHNAWGGHSQNNQKVLKGFEDKGKNYFSYKCS
jgi:hypothetical protein